MRGFVAAGALALAAFFFCAPGYAQSPASAKHGGKTVQFGGNKVLMEDWVRQKQQLRDQVNQDLRRQGAVPKNGTVTFEATVVPDPKHPGKVLVRVESLTIREHPAQAQTAKGSVDPIFGPRSPGGNTEYVNGSLPVGPQKTRDSITFVGGQPQNGVGKPSASPNP